MNEIKHKDLIIAYANGAEIEASLSGMAGSWTNLKDFVEDALQDFLSVNKASDQWKFRIKPPAPKPHKHAELIKAWADGAKIEVLGPHNTGWAETPNPMWLLDNKYRIAQDN